MFWGKQKEEMLVASIFCFSHNIFKYLHLGRENSWFVVRGINSLPNDKILGLTKSKVFADDQMNVTQILKFALGRVENIVGIGENAGYQHFLLFSQCFQRTSCIRSLKVRLCGKELIQLVLYHTIPNFNDRKKEVF